MKLAILSSAPAGGAGIAAYRIYEALKENTNFEIDFIDIGLMGEVPHDVSPTFSGSNNRISNTHFTIDYASDIRDWIVDYLMRYDVINIHWASYLISISEIFALAKAGKKILFTLHDYYYFTGGCHYPSNCTRFEKSCVLCPQVDVEKCSQLSIMNAYRLKKTLFSYSNIHVSAPSQFIIDAVFRSGMVPRDRLHVIRNAYNPISEPILDDNNLSILLISDSFSENRKGLPVAVESLNIAAEIQNDFEISVHLVGGVDHAVLSLLNLAKIKAFTHGHVKNHDDLVSIYKRCRFILTASYEDNWPNILVEGGAYGCIPIVGPGHGCEEFVKLFDTGVVSTSYKAEDFAIEIIKAIKAFKANSALAYYLSKAVRDCHSYKHASNEYVRIFKLF
jgi:glycosyltransferase involved in cell wall biosynthesis